MRGAFDGYVTVSREGWLSLRTGSRLLLRWRSRTAEDLMKKCRFDGVKGDSTDG